MSDYRLPEFRDNPLLEKIIKLEKEVSALRSHNPLNSATQNDAEGVRRLIFGAFGSYEDYGLTIMSEDGAYRVAQIGTISLSRGSIARTETGLAISVRGEWVFLATEESGWYLPGQQVPFGSTAGGGNPYGVSTGGITVWDAETWAATADSVSVSMYVGLQAGTNGQVRLSMDARGLTFFTPWRAVPAGGDNMSWNWKPTDLMAPSVGNVTVRVEVRRTSGTGYMYSWRPRPLLFRPSFWNSATVNG